MKKFIAQEDLEQLTLLQKCRLFELWKPYNHQLCCTSDGEIFTCSDSPFPLDYYKSEEYKQQGILPLLSVGDCIELIRQFNQYFIYTVDEVNVLQVFDLDVCDFDDKDCKAHYDRKELIYALWECILDIL